MSLSTNKRRIILGVLLVGSIGAAVSVSSPPEGAVVQPAGGTKSPVRSAERNATGSALVPRESDAENRVERLSVRLIDSELSPVFSVSAKPIRPGMASAEKQVEVPPTAPPLPFRFLGRMQEDRASAVFLAIEDRNLVVRSGDTIDEIYRVESIDGGNIEFTYLPLKQKQVLPVGERS